MPKTTNPFARKRPVPSPLKATKPSASGRPAKDTPLEERLEDTGRAPSLAPTGTPQSVQSLIRYIHDNTWTDIPSEAAGMGSERIGQILRFRAALPKVTSAAHLHALSLSSTETERELARLIAGGVVRKMVVPGRGKGGAAVGEGVVLVEDWKRSIREDGRLQEEVKSKYLHLMDTQPTSPTTSVSSLSAEEVRAIVQAGYLVSNSALTSGTNGSLLAPPGPSLLRTLSQSGHTSATGTLAAVGGTGAVHETGGGGSILATSSNRPARIIAHQTMTFSLPSTGGYLKLLTTARAHLVALLSQLSPRHKESTLSLLKEKWDGNIPNDATSRAKRERGDWNGVLPGKTRKWREFSGLRFEWVLSECVGSGLVELFGTGMGEVGVRVC